VWPRQCECGGEQPRFFASELQVRDTDGAQPAESRSRIGVLAAHAGDATGHPGGELAHADRADSGEQLVAVSEVPVGGVGYNTLHPGRFTEHHRVRAASPGQLEPSGDQAIADGASRPPWSHLACLRWWLTGCHQDSTGQVDSVH